MKVSVSGKRVAIVGQMKIVNREKVEAALVAAGAVIDKALKPSTNVLVVGALSNAIPVQIEKAKKLNIEIVDWSNVDLNPLLQAAPSTAAALKSQLQAAGQQPDALRAKLEKALEAQLAHTSNWANDGQTFRVWLENGRTIELPVEPNPGPLTPTWNVPEIVGQPELLFELARAWEKGRYFMLTGPAGTGKSTVCQWFAKQLNWNLVLMPCSRGLEEEDMVGTYRPGKEKGSFPWVNGPVSTGTIESQAHPTLLVFEEMNRVGNQQVFARIYSLLDDTKLLDLKEKMDDNGVSEVLRPGTLMIGATMNPADSDDADYIGTTELDPALLRRFGSYPTVGYPPEDVEAQALVDRVAGLALAEALQMVQAATAIRKAETIRFPISFSELSAWGEALAYYGWNEAAESTVVAKAHPDYRSSIRDLLTLRPGGAA